MESDQKTKIETIIRQHHLDLSEALVHSTAKQILEMERDCFNFEARRIIDNRGTKRAGWYIMNFFLASKWAFSAFRIRGGCLSNSFR